MTAYGYIRVSTDPQSKKHGPSVQRAAIEHYCESQDLELVKVFEDAITGKSEQRWAFDQMLSLAPFGEAKHVVTYKTSRIGREIRVSHNMAHEITKAGYVLHTTDQGEFNFSNVGDRTRFAASTLADQIEYDNMVQRLYESKVVTASKGKIPTKFDGFGWRNFYHPDGTKELIADENQKAWLNQMYHWAIEGLTMKEIAEKLNDLRVESSKGRVKWMSGQVGKLLRRKSNTGFAEFRFHKTGKNILVKVPQLVSPELFDTARPIIEKRQAGGRPGFTKNLERNVLLSLVRCGHCRNRMTVHNYARKNLVWNCDNKNCDHKKTHKHKDLLAVAETLICELAERPEMLSGYQTASNTLKGQLEKQLERLQERENNLIDLAEYGSINKEQLKQRLDRLNQERIGLLNQLQQEKSQQRVRSFNYQVWADQLKLLNASNKGIREIMLAAKLELIVFANMRVEASLFI